MDKMSLKEYLDIYKSVKKLYLYECKESKKKMLFQSIDDIPRHYLTCEVIEWSYVPEIINMSRIIMIPSVKIRC